MGEKLLNAYGIEVQLTREQKACVEYIGDKTLIIKGLAGTGKSLLLAAIAMQRHRECAAISKKKIAIFTYQESLIPTIQEVLHQNEIPADAIYVGTIPSYANQIYKGFEARKLVPEQEYFQENSYDLKKKKNFIKKALLIFQQKHRSHYFIEINIDTWVEEFNWMKDMNIWIEDRQYFLEVVDNNTRIKHHMGQHDKELLFNIYCIYCDLLVETNQAEYIDQILTINRHTEQLDERERFEYVLLDEAQECSNAQIQFLHYLTNQTMYMAMDINQKLYEKTWSMQQLGLQYVIKKLSQSLRMTTTIDELAESLRIQNDQYLSVEDRILNVSSKREGKLPQIIHFTEADQEKAYIQEIIKKCLLNNGANTIGIIASTLLCLETYQEWLTEASIPFEVITPITPYSCNSTGVKIVTVYGAKGLEFDYVLIPQFIEGVFPFAFTYNAEEQEIFYSKMRSMAYLAMTRAKKNLLITITGDSYSRFIDEMVSTGYEWYGTNKPEPRMAPVDSLEYAQRKEARPKEKPSILGGSNIGIMEYLKNQGVEFIDRRVIDRNS